MNINTKIQISIIIAFFIIVGIVIFLPGSLNNQVDFENETKTVEDSSLYKPVLDYETAVISAIDSANPSVVSIIVTKDIPVMERCLQDPFGGLDSEFRDFFGGGFDFYAPCPGDDFETTEIGGGSGFVVSSDGLVATNKHVVSDKEADYIVLTNDGERLEAEVLAIDPTQDIAIVKVDLTNTNIVPIELGDSDSIKLGQTAIAIGNALAEFRNTVSVGIVSGLSRNITATGGGLIKEIRGVIQTDAAINRGNSGGPLLNLEGQAIGINTAVVVGAQNIGFAIPINQVKRALESIEATGSIQAPFLGVRYINITPQLAIQRELPVEAGALVEGENAIFPDSPAESAGIMEGDIIVEINNQKLT
ncbi:MAG: trypsin-like peptidase domain-containing protein, partial [Candidatus Paceibacterota bacterium]